jgi:hypothetical protein
MQEPMLKMVYGLNVVPNPLAQILVQQDSLKLRAEQADSIASLNRGYLVRLDSIWSPVAKYLAVLPDHYDRGEAWDHYLSARRATIDLLARLSPLVKGLLSGDQIRMLPATLTAYLDPRYLASIRSGTATFASAGAMPTPALNTAGMVQIQGGAVMIRRPD